MNIGIIGSGIVGRTLGAGLVATGDSVMIGSREPNGKKLEEWKSAAGSNARTGQPADAAAFGELIIVATKFEGTQNAITIAGVEHFRGKVVIDTTNPIAPVPPTPEGLISFSVGTTDSAGEQIQRVLPESHVVKVFSCVGSSVMVNPTFNEGDPDMYICGNAASAKHSATELLQRLGWKSIIDCGNIEASRAIEPLAVLWCIYGFRTGMWGHAFRILRG